MHMHPHHHPHAMATLTAGCTCFRFVCLRGRPTPMLLGSPPKTSVPPIYHLSGVQGRPAAGRPRKGQAAAAVCREGEAQRRLWGPLPPDHPLCYRLACGQGQGVREGEECEGGEVVEMVVWMRVGGWVGASFEPRRPLTNKTHLIPPGPSADSSRRAPTRMPICWTPMGCRTSGRPSGRDSRTTAQWTS